MNKKTTISILFGMFLLVFASCTYDLPNAPLNDNPLDPGNPNSGGNPYNIQIVALDNGFRITWDSFTLPNLVGFTIMKQINDGPLVPVATISDTFFVDTDDIARGNRYFYKVAVKTGADLDTLSQYNHVTVYTDPVFTINGDEPSTQSNSVNLGMTAFAAESMRLTNDPVDTLDDAGWEWQDFQTDINWSLLTGAGDKTVYMQVRYDTGTESRIICDSIQPLIAQANEFIIAASQDTVQSNVVDIILRSQYADLMQVSPAADFAGAEWVEYDSTFQWNLGLNDYVGDGIASHQNGETTPHRDAEDYTLYARVKNSFEVISVALSGGVVVEIFGSAVINNGDTYTGSPMVTVSLVAPQASMVALSNSMDEISENPVWIAFANEIDWQLPYGDGMKTVYVRFMNQSGAQSQIYSDSIMPLPIQPTMEIVDDDGNGFTSIRTIDLQLTADGVDLEMMLSESPDFVGADRRPFDTEPQFELSEGAGLKTVYVKIINPFQMEAIVSDAIEPMPLYPALEIDAGASATNNPEAQLAMPGVNALEMIISTMDDFSHAQWEPYQPAITFMMPQEVTRQSIYAKFRHEFFETETVCDTILLDMVCSAESFTWTSANGNPHFIGDTLRFELVMTDDDIGHEIDGAAVVTIQDIADDITLDDQGDGRYIGEYIVQESDLVRYGDISVDFTDRGGNLDNILAADYIHIHARSYYWSVTQTNVYHTLNIQAGFINEQQLNIGDRIGVFTPDGVCAGAIEITDRGYPIRIYTYGDYPFTDQVEGFNDGEQITFRVWDSDLNLEVEAVAFDVIDGDIVFHDRAQTSLSVRGILNGN